MVEAMKPGSVVVDLAAEQGGNCKLTRPDEVVEHHGVKILGYTDLPSRMAAQSSQLYGTNLRHLLADLTPDKDGTVKVNMEDEVIRGATVVHDGEITWPPPGAESCRRRPGSRRPRKPAAAAAKGASHGGHGSHGAGKRGARQTRSSRSRSGAIAVLGVGAVAPRRVS